MKKIFFIFAMMLMSVVSALAEESYEEFYMTDWEQTYHDEHNHFTVSGDDYNGFGFYISDGKMFTISSNNGEKITRVEYTIGWGWKYADRLNASAGNIDVEKSSINDVNATSLRIYSDVEDYFQIDYIKVYYESGDDVNNGGNANPFVLDEYVQTETFATISGDRYIGNNIIVLGSEGDADGLLVNSTKYLQIRYKNNSLVEILKVDLEFSSDVDGDKLNSNAGGDSDGSGKSWSISNINESSTMITYGGGNAYVKNIKVYYIEANNKTVTIAPTTGDLEYSEGCITVTGTKSSFQYGLDIDNGNSLTITADSDVEILKVDLEVNSIYSGPLGIESSIGNVEGSGDNWTINDVNSSSLTISHPSSTDQVQINNITIYYRQVFAPSTILVTAKKAEVAYWSTFYSSIANYQAPEGTKVYKVNDDGIFITTTEIEDRIVTKGQGVVLKSLTSGNIVMTKVASGSSDDYSGNSLTGTGVAITNPGNAYGLNYKPSSGVGFYKLSSTGTIGANKAYLVSDNAAARAFFAFDTDATTGIDKVNALDSEKKVKVKAFDLQGRRVAKPAKGLYIVNGKKVIMK